jgi:hypothetical protein
MVVHPADGVVARRPPAQRGRLAERVSEHLLPAIQDGGVAIVVATPGHRRSFERYLADVGVDVAAASARGAYLALDASQTMRIFMVADRPDPAGFWQAISPLLRQAARAGRPVRVFGEMVALLWDASLIDAAIEVEALTSANEAGPQASGQAAVPRLRRRPLLWRVRGEQPPF